MARYTVGELTLVAALLVTVAVIAAAVVRLV